MPGRWEQMPLFEMPPERESEQMALFEMPEEQRGGRSSQQDQAGFDGGGGYDSIPIYDDDDQTGGRAAAQLTVVPTSSTNPDRPRTIAAGYDKGRKVMTVVFRDGTWWNYYGVNLALWNNFKKAYSKGWYLRNTGLDTWPNMGPADVAVMQPQHRMRLENHARMVQSRLGGFQTSQLATPSAAAAARKGMDRAMREDAVIKSKGITGPDGMVSNPYIERKRREAARRANGTTGSNGNRRKR